MRRNTLIKLLSTLTLTGMLTVGAAGNVLAQPNGYYINGTEYLFSDVASNPSMIQIINNALGGDLNNLALDLNGSKANYFAAFNANGGQLSYDLFNTYAAQHPYTIPANSTVYNPTNPSTPITNTDASTTITVNSVSAINNTLTVSMTSTVSPVIGDFKITANGVAVTPTAISTTGSVVTLIVPTVVTQVTDQPIVYSVSYKGETPVVANIQVTPNSVKVGQNFNVVLYTDGSSTDGGYSWTYTTNNAAIKFIQVNHSNLAAGSPIEEIFTFQATQAGSCSLHFSLERPWEGSASSIKAVDYIINVT